MMYYVIALAIILLDQFTKYLIIKTMELGESFTVIDNFLSITSHRNPGAAWGILAGQMWFFYTITVVVIIGLVFYIQKMGKAHPLFGTALAFMLGGAIGNFIDRLLYQEVVDFIDTNIFGYNFPIFNVADSALTIGVILMMIFLLFEEKFLKERKNG
ncbi:MAG: signal peptidase II [Bacillus sp. (in: firmicutes)]